ncbi:MAG: hypothetical protein AAF604_07600 [Acidobacteriota bacterium]
MPGDEIVARLGKGEVHGSGNVPQLVLELEASIDQDDFGITDRSPNVVEPDDHRQAREPSLTAGTDEEHHQ